MAAFDEEVLRQDRNRMTYLENHFQHLLNEVPHLRSIVAQPPPPPPQHVRPNLNLPQTPPRSLRCLVNFLHLNLNFFSFSLATKIHTLILTLSSSMRAFC